MPASSNNLVIAGIDNKGLLHIRIFGAGGSEVMDMDETKLPATQAKTISGLKQRLPGLLPPRELIRAEKDQLISDVKSIVGKAHPEEPQGRLYEPAPLECTDERASRDFYSEFVSDAQIHVAERRRPDPRRRRRPGLGR